MDYSPNLKLPFLLVALAITSLSAALSAQALQITDVRVDRRAFIPADNEQVTIKFQLSEAADVDLLLYDGREVLIRQINQAFDAGEHALTWDGRDNRGQLVPNEAYHYVVRGRTGAGVEQTYDLTDITGGQATRPTDATWDAETQSIAFSLTKPSRINVRVGMQKNGPLLRTVVDWVPRAAGANRVDWDGWDASGVLNLSDHPRLNIFVDAYALSDNTLLVGQPPDAVSFAPIAATKSTVRQKATQAKRMHYHQQQPLDERGDIDIQVSLAGDFDQDADGVSQVSGRVPIRLEVSPEDRERVLERRFEPVFFVDGTFAFENEVGYLPFTWIWDTANTAPGEHYVSVNLRGYEGNFGVATVKVNVIPSSGSTE